MIIIISFFIGAVISFIIFHSIYSKKIYNTPTSDCYIVNRDYDTDLLISCLNNHVIQHYSDANQIRILEGLRNSIYGDKNKVSLRNESLIKIDHDKIIQPNEIIYAKDANNITLVNEEKYLLELTKSNAIWLDMCIYDIMKDVRKTAQEGARYFMLNQMYNDRPLFDRLKSLGYTIEETIMEHATPKIRHYLKW